MIFPRMHFYFETSLSGSLPAICPCHSNPSSSKMVDRCINLAQSPTKKRHCQTARVEVSKEEKEPFLQAAHLHEGKRPRAHVARGRSHVGRERSRWSPAVHLLPSVEHAGKGTRATDHSWGSAAQLNTTAPRCHEGVTSH